MGNVAGYIRPGWLLESDRDDIDRYLGVLHDRVTERRTGARWALESLVFSVGWTLPALTAVVDPELSSPLFDLDPEGLGVARFATERLPSAATGLVPEG